MNINELSPNMKFATSRMQTHLKYTQCAGSYNLDDIFPPSLK